MMVIRLDVSGGGKDWVGGENGSISSDEVSDLDLTREL